MNGHADEQQTLIDKYSIDSRKDLAMGMSTSDREHAPLRDFFLMKKIFFEQ